MSNIEQGISNVQGRVRATGVTGIQDRPLRSRRSQRLMENSVRSAGFFVQNKANFWNSLLFICVWSEKTKPIANRWLEIRSAKP